MLFVCSLCVGHDLQYARYVAMLIVHASVLTVLSSYTLLVFAAMFVTPNHAAAQVLPCGQNEPQLYSYIFWKLPVCWWLLAGCNPNLFVHRSH